MVEPSQIGPLIQRLLTRMVHMEYRVLRDATDHLQDVSRDLETMRRAHQLEAADMYLADAWAAAPRPPPAPTSHRGPGSEAPRPPQAPTVPLTSQALAPAPASAPDRAVEIAQGLLPRLEGQQSSTPAAPAHEPQGATVSPITQGMQTPTLTKGACSNSLVQPRRASHT